MLPDLTLPASLAGLLVVLRPVFTGPSFATFCGLAAGLAGQVRRRTVCGMLAGAGVGWRWPHDRAHYFFARAAWGLDELGLAVARLVVALLVPPGGPLVAAVDDSVFRRCGRKVWGAAWQHDGSSPAKNKLSFGTCFVTCGIVVALPFCSRQAAPASTASAAVALVTRLAGAFPGRAVHVVADAHYHGPALRDLPGTVVHIYGRDTAEDLAEIRCLWYGCLDVRTVRVILARDAVTTLALVTTDLAASPAELVQRYAARWSIEQAFTDARHVLGAGEARNRTRRAVERTVPFAMLVHTLVITWYARHGHDPAGIAERRRAQPWYRTKTEPAFEDMLTTLRHVMICARISGSSPAHPEPEQITAVLAAWHAAPHNCETPERTGSRVS
jgi:DDE superfamily endonuclease